MSHCITQPYRESFCYSDFRLLDKHSGSNDICRITNNKNGKMCLSSAYSFKDRFIQFLSYIPPISRTDFVSSKISLIKAEQTEAVNVFLHVLQEEFGVNRFCSNAKHHENRPGYLKCKNISVWLNAAANSTHAKEKVSIENNKALKILSKKLSIKFSRLSQESINHFIDNTSPDKHMDVMLRKIETLLQKAQVPEHLHVNLRESILEHINLNALESEYSLKSISDSIFDLMKKSHMVSGEELPTAKLFKISDNILRVLDRVNTKNDTCAGMVLAGVAELRAEVKSAGLVKKHEIRSSLQAYTMKNAYMHSLVAPKKVVKPECSDRLSPSSPPPGASPAPSSMPSVSMIPSPPAPPAPSSMPSVSMIPSPPPPPVPTSLLVATPLQTRTKTTKTSATAENKYAAYQDELKEVLSRRRQGMIPSPPPPPAPTSLLAATPLQTLTKTTKTPATAENKYVTYQDELKEVLSRRRNGINGGGSREVEQDKDVIDNTNPNANVRQVNSANKMMLEGFDKMHLTQSFLDLSSSNDSGLDMYSSRSSNLGDAEWNA